MSNLVDSNDMVINRTHFRIVLMDNRHKSGRTEEKNTHTHTQEIRKPEE